MKTHTHTHTPGPWSVSNGLPIVWAKDGERQIADCDKGPLRSAGEDLANAYLIASAPDLFEALEDAAFLMRMAAKIAGPMQDSFKRSAEDAAKALAKAEGRE